MGGAIGSLTALGISVIELPPHPDCLLCFRALQLCSSARSTGTGVQVWVSTNAKGRLHSNKQLPASVDEP